MMLTWLLQMRYQSFKFYDPKTPFFTSPRFLPPTKFEKSRIKDAIISHGCFLQECSVVHSIVGERSRLDSGVELKDTLMLGADYYQTESEIASLLAEGKVPIVGGRNSKIRVFKKQIDQRKGSTFGQGSPSYWRKRRSKTVQFYKWNPRICCTSSLEIHNARSSRDSDDNEFLVRIKGHICSWWKVEAPPVNLKMRV